jgi:hypothetical protein
VAAETIAPVVRVLAERGAALRPEIARELSASLLLRFQEGYPPVRVEFHRGDVHVFDDDSPADVEIHGRLPDVVALINTPLKAGVPNPFDADGRATISRLVNGSVRVEGSRTLGRRILQLLSLT